MLKYPAVTICPKISTKYAIAERLGNYIDPLNLPEELLSLRHDFLTCASGLSKRQGSDFMDYNGYKFFIRNQWKAVSKVVQYFEKLLD